MCMMEAKCVWRGDERHSNISKSQKWTKWSHSKESKQKGLENREIPDLMSPRKEKREISS